MWWEWHLHKFFHFSHISVQGRPVLGVRAPLSFMLHLVVCPSELLDHCWSIQWLSLSGWNYLWLWSQVCLHRIKRAFSKFRILLWARAVVMVDVDGSRIYEVLNPRDPPSWTATNGSKIVQRSKTIATVSSSHRMQNGFANYAVPRCCGWLLGCCNVYPKFVTCLFRPYRSVNAMPPVHRPDPPALPPRNRHSSDGERELPLSASLGSSPSDRGFIMSGRIRMSSGNMCVH